MDTRRSGIVVLSESVAGEALSRAIVERGMDAAWCRDLEELLRGHPLPSLSVLVMHLDPGRKGPLLLAVGRLAVEYPGLQKVAIVEDPLSLPVAVYLTACAVELVRARLDLSSLDGIASAVGQARERQAWSLAATGRPDGLTYPQEV